MRTIFFQFHRQKRWVFGAPGSGYFTAAETDRLTPGKYRMTKPGSLGSQISPSALAPPGFEITSEELAALTPVDLINRLRRLIAMEPNLARHQGNLAVTLSLDNCSEDAAQTLERAVVLDVVLARVHHNLAKVYSGLGRRTEALISLTRTLCLTPGDPDALEAWADAQTSRGDQQAIQAAFLRVIATAPDRADAWITRGLALAVLGRPVDTQRCLETAVQLRPNDPTFQRDHHARQPVGSTGERGTSCQTAMVRTTHGDAFARHFSPSKRACP
jgi:tetratricopeptide (TPR) repeat protein